MRERGDDGSFGACSSGRICDDEGVFLGGLMGYAFLVARSHRRFILLDPSGTCTTESWQRYKRCRLN
jgi:hypothetical protein